MSRVNNIDCPAEQQYRQYRSTLDKEMEMTLKTTVQDLLLTKAKGYPAAQKDSFALHISHTSTLFCKTKGLNFSNCKSTWTWHGVSMLTLTLLIAMLTVPAPTLAFPSDSLTLGEVKVPPLPITCYRHFGHRVQACVDPFTSLLQLYDDSVEHLRHPLAVAKHICLEYQMVLLCLHSALTDCPTLKNLKHVQTTLDSLWVVRMNELCSIQSKSGTQLGQSEYEDLTNYLYKHNLPNSMDSYQIAQNILDASLDTTSRIEQEIVSIRSDENGRDDVSTLLANKRRLSPTLRKEIDLLDRQEHDNTRDQSAELQLNIFQYIGKPPYYQSRLLTKKVGEDQGAFYDRFQNSAAPGLEMPSISIFAMIACSCWLLWYTVFANGT